MWLLYDNAAVLASAAVCCVLAWLYGGIVASALLPTVPWLLAFLFEMMLCFPQRHRGETTYEARERTWRRLKSDPLSWIVVVFLLLLLVPFFNKGLCPCCDYPAINFDGQSQAPPVPLIPFCVDRMEHLNVTVWFFSAFLAMLAVKHALLKRGKRLFLRLMAWNGAALCILGMVQYVSGAEAPLWSTGWDVKAYFFSTFGYPNMGGDYFTSLFAISVGLWRWDVDQARKRTEEGGHAAEVGHRKFWRRHLMLVPAMLLAFSAVMTLSRAAILLTMALAVVFYAHAFTSFLDRMGRTARVKAIAANLIAVVIAATVVAVLALGRGGKETGGDLRDDVAHEISTLDGRGIIDRVAGKGQYHVRVALKVWRDNLFFGCGGWGYKHFCVPAMTDEDFRQMQKAGGINVHDDYVQFLAEHGLVGFGLIVAAFALLVVPVFRTWHALAASVRFMDAKKRPPRPAAVFAFPAGAFCVLMGCLATIIHGFADCPLRSPAVLSLFFASLAAVDGFLPRLKKKD